MGTRYCIHLKWGMKRKNSNEIAIGVRRNMYKSCNKTAGARFVMTLNDYYHMTNIVVKSGSRDVLYGGIMQNHEEEERGTAGEMK